MYQVMSACAKARNDLEVWKQKAYWVVLSEIMLWSSFPDVCMPIAEDIHKGELKLNSEIVNLGEAWC